jgi:hypothetical protein
MSHGKRYSAMERKDILKFLENHTYQETMDKFGVSQMSLARWVKNQKKRETTTSSSLLNDKIQKELQIYLNLIENSDNIRAAAIITAAGELLLPESMGLQSFFGNVNEIIPIISNFLLCAQGFTAAVVNEQKQMNVVFDDLSIKTPIGTFVISSVGRAVLVTLNSPELDLQEIFAQDSNFISRIKNHIFKKLV